VPCGGVPYGDSNTCFIANDWHTALLPVYLQARRGLGGGGLEGLGSRARPAAALVCAHDAPPFAPRKTPSCAPRAASPNPSPPPLHPSPTPPPTPGPPQAHYRDYGQMTYSRSVFVIHNMAHQGRAPFVESASLELNDK
jgi:hypothetical protein